MTEIAVKKNVVVFDIETVPDSKLWQPTPEEPEEPTEAAPDPTKCMRCLQPLAEGEKRKCEKMDRAKCKLPPPPKERKPRKKKDEFPPLYAHQVVCISGLWILDNVPQALISMSAEDATQEYHTIKEFGAAMDAFTVSPNELEVVTWFGRHFDARVLELRSLRHGLSQKWIAECERASPYAEVGHLDLKEILGKRDGFSLSKASEILSLESKATSGADVKAMYEAGQHELIADYCKADSWRTALAYYRYMLLRGRLVGEEYEVAVGQLYGLLDCEEHAGAKLYSGVV